MAAKALVPDERAVLHGRLADHLIDRATDLMGPELARIGRHLHEANRPEEAGQFCLPAAAPAPSAGGLSEGLTRGDRAGDELGADSDYRFDALDLRERLQAELGETEERRKTLDELAELVAAETDSERRVHVLVRQGRFEFDQGSMETSEVHLRAAAEEAERIGFDVGHVAALTQLASVLRSTGRMEAAWEAARLAETIYDEKHDPAGAANLWNQFGILHTEGGDLDAALAAYNKVVELARRGGSRRMDEIAQINIGYCLVKKGELEQAVNTYRQALHEIVQLGNRVNEAALLANLGHAQILLGDFARAEHSLKRCVRLSKKVGDPLRIADGYLTLAAAHLSRGRVDEAEKCLKPGLKAAEVSQNTYLVCHAYLLYAELRLKRLQRGDLEAALAKADEVLEVESGAGHSFARARAQSLKARIYARMDRKEDALASAQLAVGAVREGEVEGGESVLYHHALLMHGYERDDEAKRAAAEANERYIAIRDRILNPKTRKNFENLRGNRRIADLNAKLNP